MFNINLSSLTLITATRLMFSQIMHFLLCLSRKIHIIINYIRIIKGELDKHSHVQIYD